MYHAVRPSVRPSNTRAPMDEEGNVRGKEGRKEGNVGMTTTYLPVQRVVVLVESE